MAETETKNITSRDSILNSIKRLLGLTDDYTDYDDQIIMHINSVFFNLNQLGVGPSEGFSISDSNAIWTEYISDNALLLGPLSSYIYLKVKLLFDPPTNSSAIQSIEKLIAEFEWRINITAETSISKEVNSDV